LFLAPPIYYFHCQSGTLLAAGLSSVNPMLTIYSPLLGGASHLCVGNDKPSHWDLAGLDVVKLTTTEPHQDIVHLVLYPSAAR